MVWRFLRLSVLLHLRIWGEIVLYDLKDSVSYLVHRIPVLRSCYTVPSTWQELSVLDKMTEGMGKGFLFPFVCQLWQQGLQSLLLGLKSLAVVNVQFIWGYLLKQVRKLFQELSSSWSAIHACVMPRDGVTLLKSKHCLPFIGGLTSALFWCCGWVPSWAVVLHLWEYNPCGVGPSLVQTVFFIRKRSCLMDSLSFVSSWILDAFAWVRNLPLGSRRSDALPQDIQISNVCSPFVLKVQEHLLF